MGEKTGIAWCDHTFNPWFGCARVSPACENCYAERDASRYRFVDWGPHAERRKKAADGWKEPVRWNKSAAKSGTRRRVFCASWADVFDKQAPQAWRDELFDLIKKTPHLDWLLLTKRPQNINKMLPGDWGDGYQNVWLGATAEDQTEFDRRWPILAATPAAIRFISYEPALNALNIGAATPDWLICGCEKGPNQKPLRHMPDQWSRDVRDACASNGVAFFMKQMAVRGVVTDELDAFPLDLRVREYPAARRAEVDLFTTAA